jgi:hypothetical protein
MRWGGSCLVEMTRTFVQPVAASIQRMKLMGVVLPLDLTRVARKAAYLPSGDVRVTPAFDSLTRHPWGLDHLKYRPCWA